MRMFFKILKYRFVSGLKHPVVLTCLLVALLSALFVGIYSSNTQDTSLYPIAIVDEDGGEYAEIFINQISENKQVEVVLLDRETATKQVSTGKLDGAFVLDKKFSEKISRNDFEDIVEFISPTVTTSAYPVSEIASSEIIDLWLMKIVENTLRDLHSDLGNEALISYEEAFSSAKKEYEVEDIIIIEYIGDSEDITETQNNTPIDKAVGIYVAFVIFAIMLSGEWVFNIKQKDLQNRFVSNNTDITYVCLGSQVASTLVCMLFFVPLVVFLGIYLSVGISAIFYLSLGMLLFSLCICFIAFIISTFAENLTQLVVIGTSVSIINILISSLAIPLPNWASTANAVAKILPGTYLLGCYENKEQFLMLTFVTLCWAAIGYLSILRIRKKFGK